MMGGNRRSHSLLPNGRELNGALLWPPNWQPARHAVEMFAPGGWAKLSGLSFLRSHFRSEDQQPFELALISGHETALRIGIDQDSAPAFQASALIGYTVRLRCRTTLRQGRTTA